MEVHTREGLRQAGLLEKSLLSSCSHDDLKPAIELAVKVAVMTVSRAGTNPPWATEPPARTG